MPNTFAVPKPKRQAVNLVTLKFNGSPQQEIAFSNGLNRLLSEGLIDGFSCGKWTGRKDGDVDRTYFVEIVGETSYDTRAEKKYVDKSGHVYLFLSRITPGKYKLGESIHPLQRVGEVSRDFAEPFRRLHVIHTDNAKALEHALHLKYAAVREGDSEIFWLTDSMVDEIYAL